MQIIKKKQPSASLGLARHLCPFIIGVWLKKIIFYYI